MVIFWWKRIPITKPYNEVNTCLTFGLIIPVNFIFKSESRKSKFSSQAISWNNAIYPIQNQFFNYNKEHFNLELTASIKEIPNSMSEVINLDSIIKYITKFPIIQSNLFKLNQIFRSMINYSITRECENTQIVLKSTYLYCWSIYLSFRNKFSRIENNLIINHNMNNKTQFIELYIK